MPALNPVLLLYSALWLAVLALALQQLVHSTRQWLLACFLSSGLYVAMALRLDSGPPISPLLDGLRWGLLGAALFSFFRYRRSRRDR